jgi:hypothetical protein
MAMFYPYRIIPNTVCVLPLDETQPLSRFVSLKDSRTFA